MSPQGGEWSALRPGRIIPWKVIHITYWIRGCVDTVLKKTISFLASKRTHVPLLYRQQSSHYVSCVFWGAREIVKAGNKSNFTDNMESKQTALWSGGQEFLATDPEVRVAGTRQPTIRTRLFGFATHWTRAGRLAQFTIIYSALLWL
jgi:hypothetical protein